MWESSVGFFCIFWPINKKQNPFSIKTLENFPFTNVCSVVTIVIDNKII